MNTILNTHMMRSVKHIYLKKKNNSNFILHI